MGAGTICTCCEVSSAGGAVGDGALMAGAAAAGRGIGGNSLRAAAAPVGFELVRDGNFLSSVTRAWACGGAAGGVASGCAGAGALDASIDAVCIDGAGGF